MDLFRLVSMYKVVKAGGKKMAVSPSATQRNKGIPCQSFHVALLGKTNAASGEN